MPFVGISPERSTMDYVLLSPGEVGALLDLPPDAVVALVESGELGGLRVAGQWRVPLVSIARRLAAGDRQEDAAALQRVLVDAETWTRVFGAHPEVLQSLQAGDFPPGSVGAGLRAALVQIDRKRAAAQADLRDTTVQDPDYRTRQRGNGGA